MDAQPDEEFSSNKPVERRELGGELASNEPFDLDELLAEPRRRAAYFNAIISERFPTGGYDSKKRKTEEQSSKAINAQLKSYEFNWLKHVPTINNEYRTIIRSSPELLPEISELSFDSFNRFLIAQWYEVFGLPKSPRMNAGNLGAVQTLLAMESATILSTLNTPDELSLFARELSDRDALINLLQVSIDTAVNGQPKVIVVPYPKIKSVPHQPDFLIFEPTQDGSFNKMEVQSTEVLDPERVPGSVAIDLLHNSSPKELFAQPEFQEKNMPTKLILARRSIESLYQNNRPAAVERPTEHITKRFLTRD